MRVCDDIINVIKAQCNVSWMPCPIKDLEITGYHTIIRMIAQLHILFVHLITETLLLFLLNNSDTQYVHYRSKFL